MKSLRRKWGGVVITLVWVAVPVFANVAPVEDATQTQGYYTPDQFKGQNAAQNPIPNPQPAHQVAVEQAQPVAQTTPNLAMAPSPTPIADHSNATSNNDAQSNSALDALSSMTVQQRLTRLEQQMNNFTQMNLPQEISDLQQTVQQINGQLQVQQHDIKLLNDQLRSFYQDLSQQIQHFKNLNSNDGSDNSSDSSTSSNSQTMSSISADSLQLKETNAYNKAFNLLRSQNYDQAQASFSDYLNDYPNGKFVVNAYYWIGQIDLVQKNLKSAAKNFNQVISQFPKSNKVPDAKLKLSMILIQQGKIDEAKQKLLSIRKQYPNSTAAQLANIELQQLNDYPIKQNAAAH